MDATSSSLSSARVLAVMRVESSSPEAASAAVQRGIDLVLKCKVAAIEVTVDSPRWRDILRGLVANCSPAANVGVGSVVETTCVEEAAEIGAKFALSPVNPPGFVESCFMNSVVPIPGCFTPNEVYHALQQKCKFVKLFPAQLWTPESLKALRGVVLFREARFLVTGGINGDSARDWLNAGACIIGMGTSLVGRDLSRSLNHEETEQISKIIRDCHF